jgi:hypothetical protein
MKKACEVAVDCAGPGAREGWRVPAAEDCDAGECRVDVVLGYSTRLRGWLAGWLEMGVETSDYLGTKD